MIGGNQPINLQKYKYFNSMNTSQLNFYKSRISSNAYMGLAKEFLLQKNFFKKKPQAII